MKAYETANEVAEYANNMMTAGRIGGFAVRLFETSKNKRTQKSKMSDISL